MNEKWYKSVVALLGIIMLSVQAIDLIYMVGINQNLYTHADKVCTSIVAGGMAILVVIFMVLSLKKKKAGPIIGMIAGLVYIYKFTIVSVLVGIVFFVFSFGLLVELGKEDDKEKKKQKENKENEKTA